MDPVLFLGLCGGELVRQGRASRLPLGVAGSSVRTSLGGMNDKLGDFSQEDPPSLLLFVTDLIFPLSWSPLNRADRLGSCCQEARAGGPLPGAGGAQRGVAAPMGSLCPGGSPSGEGRGDISAENGTIWGAEKGFLESGGAFQQRPLMGVYTGWCRSVPLKGGDLGAGPPVP